MTKKNKAEIIKKITEEIINLLAAKASVFVQEDPQNQTVKIQIDTDSPGLLIGYHGETIDALQLLIGVIAQKKLNGWVRIILNVGDWRQKREEVLKALAKKAASEAKSTKNSVPIFNLSPFERRIIHLFLENDPLVTTESVGEGSQRHIVIRPRE